MKRTIFASAILVITLFGTAMASSTYAHDAYLCIAEASGGVGWNKTEGKWEGSGFPTGEKYIFRRAKPEDGITWEPRVGVWGLFELGHKNPLAYCYNEFPENQYQTCDDHLWILEISLETLRFKLYYPGNYTDPKNEGSDTPTVTVGTCSPI
jgi:hypothetical protein